MVPPAIRRFCVAYDLEGYSQRGHLDQLDAQARLAGVLDHVRREAGLAAVDCDTQPQGDGGLALFPTGGVVDEPRLVATLVRVLTTNLAETNLGLGLTARLRLRVALTQGVVMTAEHGFVGDAVVTACRLRDSASVRAALAADPEADLVVVVSDDLYADVVRHGLHGLPARAFVRRVLRAKSFQAPGWIWLPGRVPPPVDQPASGSDQADAASPGVHEHERETSGEPPLDWPGGRNGPW